MWGTTKSIVKEIKKNQESLIKKIEEISAEQRNSLSDLNNQMIGLSERLEHLEKVGLEELNNQILSSAHNETDNILKSVKNLMDDVCENVNSVSEQCESNLREEMEQVKEFSVSDREKQIALLKTDITEKIEQIEKNMHDSSTGVVHETKQCSNEILEKMENINYAIKELSSLSENQNTAISGNVETMNLAMQEILRNLSSLDEGNRLIIAKFLLKDMEN